jgi:hypothetical protein
MIITTDLKTLNDMIQLQKKYDHMKLEYDRMILQINTYRGELERLRRIYGTKVVPI